MNRILQYLGRCSCLIQNKMKPSKDRMRFSQKQLAFIQVKHQIRSMHIQLCKLIELFDIPKIFYHKNHNWLKYKIQPHHRQLGFIQNIYIQFH